MKQLSLALLVLALLPGCSSVYYEAMEAVGIPKRDLLVDRVEDARDSQEEAKEQFQDALDQFMAMVKVDGGELETTYRKLKAEMEASATREKAVRERIDAVEKVGEALFTEWKAELDEYTSDSLRLRSAEKLRETRAEYDRLVATMRRAERKIEPVMNAMRDQVLYLKHNLNARAIASLRDELKIVENDVSSLIKEMEIAIGEANRFLADFDGTTVQTK